MRNEDLSRAVKHVAWGYVLIHVHFNIGTIDLLPGWLAYVLILGVLPVIAQTSQSANLLRPLAVLLACWEGIIWLMGDSWVPGAVSVIVTVVSLYFHFQLLTDLAALARIHCCPQEGSLLTLRTVRTVLLTVMALPFSRLLLENELIIIALLAANLIVALCLCVVLFSLRRSLAEQQPLPD